MRQLDCIVPLRVRITGTLDDEQSVTLEDTIAAAVKGRLQFAQRTLAERMLSVPPPRFHLPTFQFPASLSPEDQAAMSSRITSAIASAITGRVNTQAPGIVLANYTPPSTPARRSAPRAMWVAEAAIDFQVRVSDFIAVIEEFGAAAGNRSQVPWEAVYADQLTAVRKATVLVISVKRAILAEALVNQVADRVQSILPPGVFFLYGYTANQRYRQRLVHVENGGRALMRLPDLSLNRLGTALEGPYFPAGSKLLFVFMQLPKVDLDESTLSFNEITVDLQLRDVAYLVQADNFEHLFNTPWVDFLHEYATTTVTLHIERFLTARAIHQDTLRYLFNDQVLQGYNSDTAVFGGLALFNRSGIDSLPAAARAPVTGVADEDMLKVAGVPDSGMWQNGWLGGYVYFTLSPSADELDTARYAPDARRNVPEIIKFLTINRDFPWSWNFLSFLSHQYQAKLLRERGSRTLAFEFLLRELESRENGRWFREFFDAVEGSGNGDLIYFVLALSSATPHASNMRVVEMLRRVNAHRQAHLNNTYDVAAKEIWIDHDVNRRLRVNMLASQLDPWYTLSRDVQQIKPARLAELQKAVAEEGQRRFAEILKGRDSANYNEETFGTEVLKVAAQNIHLSDKDLEEVTITRTLRFLDLRMEFVDGVERYYITYEHMERLEDGPWSPVPGSRREVSDNEFEFLLWSWVYNHEAAIVIAFAIGVSVLGVIVIAFEVGAVAALIDLAGGLLNVGISIAISELIYLCTAEHYTLRGFLLAALDGYLGAVGFRFGGFVGRSVAGQIGTQSIRRLIIGWIAERAVTGVVGGAATSALTIFANGLINVATGEGGFPTFGDFVRGMALGAAFGVVFEFAGAALQPLARVVGRTGIDTIAALIRNIKDEGISLSQWTAGTDSALSNISQWTRSFMEDAKALGVGTAFEERISQVTEALRDLRQAALFRRVLELQNIPVNRLTNSILDKLLSGTEGHISDESLLGLFNRLARGGRLGRFLEMMNLLDEGSISWLAEGNRLETFANAARLQDLIALRGSETGIRFLRTAFRGSVDDAEGFLTRIGRHGDQVSTTAIDTLLRPNQRVTPHALETVAARLGGLSETSLQALDRLYATARSDAADGFLGQIAPADFSRTLRFLGALGHAFGDVSAVPLSSDALQGINKLLRLAAPALDDGALAAILTRTRADAGRLSRFLNAIHALPDDAVTTLAGAGELGNLADAAHLLQLAETRGAARMWDVVSSGFGGSPAHADAWAGRLATQPQAVQARAIDLLVAQGRQYTPEGLLQVVSKAGAISNDYAEALNRLYTLRGAANADALLTGAHPDQLSLQTAQTSVPGAVADLATIEAKLVETGHLNDIGIINETGRLQAAGRVEGLQDWASSTAPNAAAQTPDFVSELVAARDLAASAAPGNVVKVGQDTNTAGRSFDVTEESGPPGATTVERRVELYTPAGAIGDATDLTPAATHAIAKIPAPVRAGAAPRPGGTFESGSRIPWPLPPAVRGGTNTRTFDANGNYETRDAAGVLVPRESGNIVDDLVRNLNGRRGAPGPRQQLNAVTFYDLEGTVIFRIENSTPGTANTWVRTR